MLLKQVEGSRWSVCRFSKMYSVLQINKTSRAGSYIKTTQTYTYPNYGLINRKHEDDECVKHCTTYHQTKQ